MIAPAILAAAALVIGKPVDVQCAPYGEWQQTVAEAHTSPRAVAFAYLDTGPVVFPDFSCRKLNRIAEGRERNERVIAANLLLLGHELGHVAGLEDESESTCFGVVRVKQLAQALGVPRPFRLRRVAAWLQTWWGEEYRCPQFDGAVEP